MVVCCPIRSKPDVSRSGTCCLFRLLLKAVLTTLLHWSKADWPVREVSCPLGSPLALLPLGIGGLDTNVIVSGLLVAAGFSGRLLDAVLTGRLSLAYDDRI